MAAWLIENMGTILTAFFLLVIVALAVRSLIRGNKSSCHSCRDACHTCHMCKKRGAPK